MASSGDSRKNLVGAVPKLEVSGGAFSKECPSPLLPTRCEFK